MADQISTQELAVFQTLRDSGEWLTNHEIADKLDCIAARRTVRATTARLVAEGLAEYAEIFPGYRYRYLAKVKNDYLARLRAAEQVLGTISKPTGLHRH